MQIGKIYIESSEITPILNKVLADLESGFRGVPHHQIWIDRSQKDANDAYQKQVEGLYDPKFEIYFSDPMPVNYAEKIVKAIEHEFAQPPKRSDVISGTSVTEGGVICFAKYVTPNTGNPANI